MKVKNCFIAEDKVLLFIDNELRIINYNQLYDDEDIVIELADYGPPGFV